MSAVGSEGLRTCAVGIPWPTPVADREGISPNSNGFSAVNFVGEEVDLGRDELIGVFSIGFRAPRTCDDARTRLEIALLEP